MQTELIVKFDHQCLQQITSLYPSLLIMHYFLALIMPDKHCSKHQNLAENAVNKRMKAMCKFTEQIKYNHMKWQPNVEHCGVNMSKQYIAAMNCYNYRQDRQTVRSQHTGYGTKLNKVSLQKELSQLQIIE